MSNLEQLIWLARILAEEIVGIAGELLLTGTEIEHVQSDYTMPAIKLLSEAEALAILASSGDRDALAALHQVTSRLAELRDHALEERGQSGG
jgi:imidazole glycerol phosphate synthase subunit HisF